ncbi:DISARM system helicase DrmA [Halobacillus halophilus]|uniref:DISARM system helicase DrmA n=1 Tax=Halobacillus halophilus TaxID=1570 RepID=UPI001CD6A164|nr:DISARM system helicase DrmA [Halobacillus halophilus]MCA1011759.1 DISARM system helicase DrmA [Halobacillus halophilus]
MSKKNQKRKVRHELIDRMRKELVGPVHKEEVLSVAPIQKYLAGVLWPMRSELAMTEDEQDNQQDKDSKREDIESVAPLANAMNPSAIGMSFLVDKENPKISVNVSLGMYENMDDDKIWKRLPHSLRVEINLEEKIGEKQKQFIKNENDNNEMNQNLRLEWIVRNYHNCFAVSLFLVNRYVQGVDEKNVDHKTAFQPKITVESQNNSSFMVRSAFSKSNGRTPAFETKDMKSNELLYRNEDVFAVGHNIAVYWDRIDKKRKAGKLATEVIPAHEVPMVIPPDWGGKGTLGMYELANMSSAEKVDNALSPLLNEYQQWIEDRREEIPTLEDRQDTAKEHMDNCEKSLQRMRDGLQCLKDDEEAFKSFQFANLVMTKQRAHSIAAENNDTPDYDEPKWRPFQIAYVLQNIKGVVHPDSEDRKIADLLFFPTGGGKTEAYLGLAAFTLGLRRRRKIEGYRTDVGVSVIMRYTLRLLTIQQFQRSTAMICACEEIRKKDPEIWGQTRFRIGLWVGKSSVPNDYDEAADIISSKKDEINGRSGGGRNEAGTPVQLVSCPWCGHKLVDEKKPKVFLATYWHFTKQRRINITCPNSGCAFHRKNSVNKEGLPVLVTDEEIYRLLPDVVIGTVDKFARMPWQPEIQNMFGKVKGEVQNWGFVSNGETKKEVSNAKNVSGSTSIVNGTSIHPPNLIIQDELHLISGPLGTMVGLYETAIDYLSTVEYNGKQVGPKVVASTATIKNADQQIEGLYTKKASIFPSPGISHVDSFFAQQQPLDETPGRMYVGLFAPGRSMKTSLLRAYSNLLSSVTAMEEEFDRDALDPYHTLVGYFNSLRELGGAVRLIEDDVPARMKTLEKLNDKNRSYRFKKRELDREVAELTSRIDSGKIPSLLSRLETKYYQTGDITPVDVLLASNMISVGVDVSRLGLMVVNGQPKTTAEYIQSTSRVGRKHPGLIFTTYNWARPRDISHYEEFYAYHSALYRYVEPISVTPFASRARDRGLGGVMVSMLRLGHDDLTSNSSANEIEKVTNYSKKIIEFFIKRATEMNLSVNEIEEHSNKLIEEWNVAAQQSKLNYSNSNQKNTSNLLYPIGDKPKGTFKTPNSMRDVEPTARIYIGRD